MSVSAKEILSVGQALLLLIKKYQKYASMHDDQWAKIIQADPFLKKLVSRYKEFNAYSTFIERLKTLYLSGATNKIAHEQILDILGEPSLAGFNIPTQLSDAVRTIDSDSTRRYFETHLAYHTFNESLKQVSQGLIERIKTLLYQFMPNKTPEDKLVLSYIDLVLAGKHPANTKGNPLFAAEEYSDCIRRIETDPNYTLGTIDKDKLKDIVRCCFLAVTVTRAFTKILPLNIYEQGYFTEKGRGREMKNEAEQSTTQSGNQGILRSTMAVPAFDKAMTQDTYRYPKPSDNSRVRLMDTQLPDETWIEYSFSKLVHPFSNSISGTLLCNLRIMLYLHQKQNLFTTSDLQAFSNYFKTLISIMLYNSGGHSLFEFVAPIMLEETQKQYRFMKGFRSLSTENLFFVGNQEAFNKALNEALDYNDTIIARRRTLHAIPQSLNITQTDQTLKASIDENMLNALKTSSFYVGNIDNVLSECLEIGSAFIGTRKNKEIEELVLVQKNSKSELEKIPLTIKMGILYAKQHKILLPGQFIDRYLPSNIKKLCGAQLLSNQDFNDYFFNFYYDMLNAAESIQEVENEFLSQPYGKVFLTMMNSNHQTALTRLIEDHPEKLDLIELLLCHRCSVNEYGMNGQTSLTNAFIAGDYRLAALLIKYNANPGSTSIRGLTTLMELGTSQQLSQARQALKLKSVLETIEYTDSQRRTALHRAVAQNNLGMIRLLIKHKANRSAKDIDGKTPLMLAVQLGYLNAASALLIFARKKAGPNILEARDLHGNTALMLAAQNGDIDMLESLLVCNARINTRNNALDTPLFFAIRSRKVAVIKFLLEHGASLTDNDFHGNNGLMLLIQMGSNNIAQKILKSKGAHELLMHTNHVGRTALHIAIMSGNQEMAKYCLEAGIDPLKVDSEGYSPLMLAAAYGRLDIVEMLLKDPQVKESINSINLKTTESALSLAVREGNIALVKMLLSHKANPNLGIPSDQAPLWIACQMNQFELVNLLLQYHASPNEKCINGVSITDCAKSDLLVSTVIVEQLSLVTNNPSPMLSFSNSVNKKTENNSLEKTQALENQKSPPQSNKP